MTDAEAKTCMLAFMMACFCAINIKTKQGALVISNDVCNAARCIHWKMFVTDCYQ